MSFFENATHKKTENELIIEYQKTLSDRICHDLMEKYEFIPKKIAKRYTSNELEYDDLFQSARIGVLHALQNFDASLGIKFETYAISCTLGEVKHFCRDRGNYIKVPRRVYDIFYRAKKESNQFVIKHGKEPTLIELADILSVSTDELECALSWGKNRIAKSLDEFLKEGDGLVFSDLLGMEDNSLLLIEDKEFIERCFKNLTDDEKLFLKYRYYDEMTQTEIAKKMNVSQMKISRMEKKVLSVLKDMYYK